MKKEKLFSLLLLLTLLIGMLAGCGSSDSDAAAEEVEEETVETETAEVETEETESTETMESEEEEASETVSASALPESYPLLCDDGSVSLSMFQVSIPLLTDIETFNELEWWQKLTERTGITFEWNMVAMAAAEDQFNLLIAAGDLPNITCTLNYYNESIAYAVENDIFVNLSDYIEAYAPDYYALIMEDDVYPFVTDDDGNLIAFYQLGYEDSIVGNGVVLRGDLLEELGLDVPVTYDEYEEVLLALKSAYDLEAPLYFFTDNNGSDWLSSGYYVQYDFSLNEDGEVIYGPMEDGYREFLSTINSWYEEGLLNEGYYQPATTTGDERNEFLEAGTSAVSYMDTSTAASIDLSLVGGYLVPGYMPRVDEEDELHLTAGITNKVNTDTGWVLSSSSTEEEIQYACMLINYFYTEEGSLFVNYGTEGVSFEYQEDGTPWYTELITDNPDGLSQFQACFHYLGQIAPSLTDWSSSNIDALTDWADFVEVWGESDNEWDMPQVTLTVDESDEYAAVSTDVDTYLDEAINRFIRGDLDIDDDAAWQDYLDDLDSPGINTMVEIYAAALERLNSR